MNKDLNLIAEKALREELSSISEIESKYPPRNLKPGAMVTRFAPSPTGFVHLGSLYASMISERLAHQTDGVFYLRIEDTDKKREVEGAIGLIIQSLTDYGVKIDEGQTLAGGEMGKYGPYKQSDREKIYKSYIKLFLEKGLAYLCFCTHEELEKRVKEQEANKFRLGYYGKWATCRNISEEEVLANIDAGKPYVIRLKSPGSFDNKIKFTDLLKGERELPENDQDIVIMKSDGLPTYHFAHLVDDHLMQTTDVIRGDEWFPSVPLHLQLFQMMGWQPPRYGHILPIQKMEGNSKRKLSKRKDPEANMAYYSEQGYPREAIIEYLLNLANSNFEDWRKANPEKDNRDFTLTLERLAHSNGALFDFNKLKDISREIVARFSAEEVLKRILDWSRRYEPAIAELLEKDRDYSLKIFSIERGLGEKSRKDIAKWSDTKDEVGYFFDSVFKLTVDDVRNLIPNMDSSEIKKITDGFMSSYTGQESKDEWLGKLKEVATKYNYAESTKAYKLEPAKYKGQLADVAKVFRVLLTGKTNTPDLYSIMQVMRKEMVEKRLSLVR